MSVSIATVPSHVAGDVFTADMWASLQANINQGVVEQVGAQMTRNASQSVADTTAVTITFDTTIQDTYSMWNGTTGIVAPVGGWYAWSALAQWAAVSVAKTVEVHFRKNGTTLQTVGSVTNNDNTHTTFAHAAGHAYLASGDVITFDVLQRTGATVSLLTFTGTLIHV